MAGPIAAATGAVFAGLARLRHARPVHPHGVAFSGTLRLEPGPGLDLLPALGAPRDVPAVVRLSRSFDPPRFIRDFLGVAVKLADLHGPGLDQDFLTVSSLPGPLGHFVPVPARRYTWAAYSSLIPYRSAGRLVVLGALSRADAGGGTDELDAARGAAARGRLRFRLAVAPLAGPLLVVGELDLREELAAPDGEALRFNPFHTGGGLEPAGGPLNGLRRSAYPASQLARPR